MTNYFKFLGLGFVALLVYNTMIYEITSHIMGAAPPIFFIYGVSMIVYVAGNIMLMIFDKYY